jgi:hypothetical protein
MFFNKSRTQSFKLVEGIPFSSAACCLDHSSNLSDLKRPRDEIRESKNKNKQDILVVALVMVGTVNVNRSQMMKEDWRMIVEQPPVEATMVSGMLPIA